jgi:RNA polymerase sigma factor (TIGR02999 family)
LHSSITGIGLSQVTRIIDQMTGGKSRSADDLLPLVYQELRALAAARLSNELPGQTLQATALVHEAYLRLVDGRNEQHWDGRNHFFSAAAEAMRRILIERARNKGTIKRGGAEKLQSLDVEDIASGPAPSFDVLDLDEALAELETHEPQAAELVKLRYFAGLSHIQAAEVLGVSRRIADRLWTISRAWLYRRIAND